MSETTMVPKEGPKWPDYQIIEVSNTLKDKVVVPGNAAQAIAAATASADAALANLSGQFPLWMAEESRRLMKQRQQLADNGITVEALDRFHGCAHDIKGQARTLGYPAAANIARLLCALIEKAPNPLGIPLEVIDQHVNAIAVVARDDIRTDNHPQIISILQGLNILNHQLLKKMGVTQAATG